MKMIEAIIRPARLEAVKQALGDVEVFRMTVSDVQGFGSETGTGPEYNLEQLARVKLEIAVNEQFVEPAVQAIVTAGGLKKDNPGDGKVFVLPLEDVVRIRTGERGPEAV